MIKMFSFHYPAIWIYTRAPTQVRSAISQIFKDKTGEGISTGQHFPAKSTGPQKAVAAARKV
jgi:hypothetical protein